MNEFISLPFCEIVAGLSSKKPKRSSKVLVTTEDSQKLEEANEEVSSKQAP